MRQEKTLKDLQPGESGRIVRLEGEGVLRRRLMDMGFVRGSRVEVKKLAPFGDPMEVVVRGYCVSLRKADAALVVVE